jgi:hypothetical protein
VDRDWVLVTEGAGGESRAAVAAVRAAAAAGYRPAVTVSGGLSLAASSRYCLARVPAPEAASDPMGYADAVHAELARRPYRAVLPASDAALLALDMPVRHLLDKVECGVRARAAGLAVPPSQVFDSLGELRAQGDGFRYPIVIKPDIKRFMAMRLSGPADLERIPEHGGRLIVQPYLSDDLRGILGLIWKGRLVAATHLRYLRIWPLPCGTVAAAVTVAPDEALEARLERLLEGYDGLFHADLAGEHLLDLNPRIHAALPLAVASGANLVDLYCQLLGGAEPRRVRGRPGLFFRWIEGDIRSVLLQLAERRIGPRVALRALRPRRGTIHSYESLRDPGPLRARLRFVARRLRHGRPTQAGSAATA